MKKHLVTVTVSLALLSPVLPAETVIQKYSGDLPVRTYPQTETLPLSISQDSLSKTDEPTTFYILPFFKIDSTNLSGETTFLSIRNESASAQSVEVELFAPNSLSASDDRQNALLPKETWVLNLRTLVTNAPDSDGFIRGWGRILSEADISADFFQFNPSQDFATGGAPLDIEDDGFCKTVKSRFLVGGTFDGGTLLTFMLDSPLGADPMTNPPSITGQIYLEDSTSAGTFEIYTDLFTLEVNAEDLLPAGVNFGSMDITFQNDFQGGAVFTEYKANNRFSVGLKSVCLVPSSL